MAMAHKGSVRKKGRGDVDEIAADWAKDKGFSREWAKGLTAGDVDAIEIVADHTDEVVKALEASIARGLEAVGIQAESDAAKLCPVDTGRLRNSITHAIDSEPAVYIGTNVEYAEYVHNGTSTHKAQPFLTDAVNQNASKYRRIFESGLKGA